MAKLFAAEVMGAYRPSVEQAGVQLETLLGFVRYVGDQAAVDDELGRGGI
ncbi:hypothetical protein LAUMK191_02874 [Mycobacterium attenuatum]|uniref:Uncharacterized protein n=1 Tax=Mycobacterium attenuatum TaxID=2341086 RepID=A0A498Q2W7_9MYCO|nr:hypothetical protein LAUMK136_02903 [Mycobacterium attenuatum]VBA53632.1 hypothetical protein LAUMK191_02874 [Mycobacterium attenuatum]VBA58390.1 hypothetical protein LAUMK41_02950 [Mycobacterium attenuatum]